MLRKFEKLIKSMDTSKRDFEIFSDFVKISALSLSSLFQPSEIKEKEYKIIWNKYKKPEKFIEMFVILADVFENDPFQDFLGTVYGMLGVSNKSTGQFFTPAPVSEIMARGTFDETEIRKNGYITINEPACGSGVNIIMMAKILKEKNYNPQTALLFEAKDLDPLCVYMCYLQASLIGLSGTVIQGNTLTLEQNAVFYTPALHNDIWQERAAVIQWYHTIERFKQILGTKEAKI